MIDTPKLIMLVAIINILLALSMQVGTANINTITHTVTGTTNALGADNNTLMGEMSSTNDTGIIRQTAGATGNMGEALLNLGNMFNVTKGMVFNTALPYAGLFAMGTQYGAINTGINQMLAIAMYFIAGVVFLINFAVYLRVFNIFYAKYQG